MAPKLFLLVSPHGLTAARLAGGRLMEVERFAGEGAAKAWADWLGARPRAPLYVLADSLEEEFRPETLPHVRGSARREMVARKLAQYFRGTPYRAACSQGRLESGRRDDRYLFMALTNPGLVEPVFKVCAALDVPLAGVWLAPCVLEPWLRRHKPLPPGVIVVSLGAAGLRQSLFVEGHLRMSRLTPVELSDREAAGRVIAEEVEKTQLFLYNARLYAREAPLSVWWLDPGGSLLSYAERLSETAGSAFRVFGARELAAKTWGGPRVADAPDVDSLLFCLAAVETPPGNLAPPPARRAFDVLRIRRALFVGAASVAIAGVTVAGVDVLRARAEREEATRLERETARLLREYREATRSFPAASVPGETMRRAVEAVERLSRLKASPEPALAAVGAVLASHPRVLLERLHWQAPEGKVGAKVVLHGELSPFDGDLRRALADIEALARDLRHAQGVEAVEITAMPVDLDPRAVIVGSTRDTQGRTGARFALSVRFAPGGQG